MTTRRDVLRLATAGVAASWLATCDPAPNKAPVAPLVFPPGFVWGAATSAYQIEGGATADGRGPSIWDTFSHTPGTIADGSNGDVACDHYHRWESDLDLMKSLHLASYRFSIAWPRVMPDGRGRINQRGLDFYRRLVDGLHTRGIAPMATLFHWDLPQKLQDAGGWENRDCAKWFADYAAAVFAALGGSVPTWLTINEPKTIVHVGYEYGTMAPGKQDPVAAAVVTHHLALAHGLAVRAFRAAATGERIGPALNLATAYPTTPDAADAARLADGVENRLYLDPVFKGSYPQDVVAAMPAPVRAAFTAAVHPGDLQITASPVDVLGMNYYNPVFVDSSGRYQTVKPTTAATWEQVWPQGLTDLLVRVSRDYPGVPVTITENGMPDSGAGDAHDDQDRIAFLRDHLRAAHAAIAAGAKLEGYHLWSLLDNFEWAQGYTQRWGIVHVDFDSLARTPKNSATWYRGVIDANAV